MVILDNFVHQQFSTKMTLETCSSRISRLIIGVFGLKIGMGMGRDCQSQGLLGQPEFLTLKKMIYSRERYTFLQNESLLHQN